MKKFKFVPSGGMENIIPPSPVKNHIPQWYKDGETYDDKEMPGLKTCVPFLDAMLSGYVITTIDDIRVSKQDGVIYIEDGLIKEDGSFEPNKKRHSHNHKIEENQISSRFINERKSSSGSTIPRPPGHLNNHFVWSGKWGWKVPRGYSVLVTHPFNRFDLPFTTVSGIIDSDGWVSSGNIPFFLKEDFQGVIPKNTPVAQLLPYKRSEWQMSISKVLMARHKVDGKAHDRGAIGYYKKKYWNRKNYN
jgi:hypothetical protein